MYVFRRPEMYAALYAALNAALYAALLMLGGAGRVRAQSAVDGALDGLVLDEGGRPARAALVEAVNQETLERAVTRTAADGRFLFPHLAPGRYTVTITPAGGIAQGGAMASGTSANGTSATETSETGAKTPGASTPGTSAPGTTETGVAVATPRRTELSIPLGETSRLRSVAASAEVRAEADPDNSALASSIAPAELAALPAAGRRWQDFALTTPGVNPDEDADGLVSARGLPATQNALVLDGADANQAYHSTPLGTGSDPAPNPDEDPDAAELTVGPAEGQGRGRHAGAAYGFSREAVREFRVDAGSYTARNGGAAGALTTVVSRGGTAHLHGSVGLVLASQALAARNRFASATSYANGVSTSVNVKPHDLRENFALTLGGPVPRLSALRFFYAADVVRRGFPAISSPVNPQFYNLTATQRALLANRGVSSAAANTALNYISSLTGPTDRRADQTIHFGRLDWQVRPRLTLGAEYNRLRFTSPAGLIDAPVVARGRASLGDANGSVDQVTARADAVLSPHWLAQLRAAYTRDLQFESPQAPLPQEPSIGPQGLAPEVNIGPNGILFGTPASLSRQAFPDEHRFEIQPLVTWAHGHHLVEFGVSFSAATDRVATLANQAGTFRYDSTRTIANAGGLVDFITDFTFNVNRIPNGACPSINAAVHLFCFTSFSQSFGAADVSFRTQSTAVFAQETWRPARRLTVNAGLRYEYLLLPLPQAPNPTLDAVFGARGATSVFPEDRNNLAPRVGLAWEPFGQGRGTLKLGYGAFFGRLPGSTLRAALADTALPASTSRIRFTPAAVVNCPQVAAQGFGYPCDFVSAPPAAIQGTTSAVVFSRRFRLPDVNQASLSLERQFFSRLDLSAGYVLNLDRQLASSTDLNILPATSMASFQLQGGSGQAGARSGEVFVLPVYTERISPIFGPVSAITSDVNASYNALVLAASLRGGRSLTVRANYSFSKALDYNPSLSGVPRTSGRLDPYTLGYDKARSSLDYPHALHVAAVWRPGVEGLPFWGRVAGALLNGWTIAPLVSVRSGRPYSYDLAGGGRLSGGHLSINGSGGAQYLPTTGRNTLRLPLYAQADLRLARGFSREVRGRRVGAQLSAEIFNLPNHVNVTSVSQRAFVAGAPVDGVTPLVFQDAATVAAAGVGTLAFGTPLASSSNVSRERHTQLGLHLEF